MPLRRQTPLRHGDSHTLKTTFVPLTHPTFTTDVDPVRSMVPVSQGGLSTPLFLVTPVFQRLPPSSTDDRLKTHVRRSIEPFLNGPGRGEVTSGVG